MYIFGPGHGARDASGVAGHDLIRKGSNLAPKLCDLPWWGKDGGLRALGQPQPHSCSKCAPNSSPGPTLLNIILPFSFVPHDVILMSLSQYKTFQLSNVLQSLKIETLGAGEMAQGFGILVLAEDPGLISRIHEVAHDLLKLRFQGSSAPFLLAPFTHFLLSSVFTSPPFHKARRLDHVLFLPFIVEKPQ